MAKAEFIHNLRIARDFFVHRVQTGQPALDPAKVETQLAQATIWLTPSSMRGFDLRDFPELAPKARTQLRDNVEHFLRVAEQVPPTKPATPGQAREAMAAFRRVIDILDPYLPIDAQRQRIREVLEQVRFPAFVRNWEFEPREDSTGDPAVWVWVYVDDKVAEQEDFPKLAGEVRQLIRDALAAAGIMRWPYIRFRTPAEQRAM
jgi:hypothetical protein